ncbi:acyl carrier protein [Actinokineospora sp. G85]|uniref:acyl carrier protein n=1 Tax=Actinokineospora sp. G85 TaxID=3406626 RepID=UPI003C728341
MSSATLGYEDVLVRVREAWADVLGLDAAEDVPLEVNFLEAGGNSLLLVMLWEELQPLSPRPVKLSELFHNGTVTAQARLLTSAPEPAVAPVRVEVPTGRSLLAQRRAAAGGAG